MTQEQLLQMIDAKEERAYTHMYNMYSKSLFAVISNMIKDKEEAEDVLQETFVKIWKNIGSYNEGKGRFYTWILNVARNTAIDKLRSKGFNNNKKNLPSDNFVHLLEDGSRMTYRMDAIGLRDFVKKLKPKCIEIINLLKELQEEMKLTYLFISHDLGVVRYISDRIAVMYLGKIVELANKHELFDRPMHPYTKALLSAIPKTDPDQRRERIILEGDIPSASKPPSGFRFHTRCPHAVERCGAEEPELVEVSSGHFVSCFLHEQAVQSPRP